MATNVLIVEDDPSCARLVVAFLEQAAWDFEVGMVTRLAEALLLPDLDLVLLDLNLPDSSGLPTVDAIVAAMPGVPVVVLTGIDDDRLAAAAIQSGARGFVRKDVLTRERLLDVIRHVLAGKQEVVVEPAHHLQLRVDRACADMQSHISDIRAAIAILESSRLTAEQADAIGVVRSRTGGIVSTLYALRGR